VEWGVGPSGRGRFADALEAPRFRSRRAGAGPVLVSGHQNFRGGCTMMRDPEQVARAQHAAARLETAWERWRSLQGLAETPAQPVVGYVGYALKEPWSQPRAVIGFSADEAERLAEFLEHGNADGPPEQSRAAAVQPAPQPSSTPSSTGQVAQVTASVPVAKVSTTGPQPKVATGPQAKLSTTGPQLKVATGPQPTFTPQPSFTAAQPAVPPPAAQRQSAQRVTPPKQGHGRRRSVLPTQAARKESADGPAKETGSAAAADPQPLADQGAEGK
jgi:hypothetical protein